MKHEQVNDTPVPLQIPLHITFRGVQPTEATERAIRDRVASLSGRRGRVVRVLVERDRPRGARQHPGRLEAAYRALVVIALPGGRQLSVRSRARGHAAAAIAEVFGVARRCLRQRPAPISTLDVAC